MIRIRLRFCWTAAILVPALFVLPGCAIQQSDFSGEIFGEPGESVQLSIGYQGLILRIPTPSPILWSIDATEGASINPLTGLLDIDAGAPDGTNFTVSAGGSSATVYVFEQPAVNPLSGYWKETAQISCMLADDTTPEIAIEELVFFPNRKFTVTRRPFETYRDYWGDYTFDTESGVLEMVIHRGNYVPDDFDGVGTFTVDGEGNLVLSDIWLGTWPSYDGPTSQMPGCGHRLTKTGLFSEGAGYTPILRQATVGDVL